MSVNIIDYRKIESPGLPTEYYFPRERVTLYDPQQMLDKKNREWPQLLFKLNEL